jgi:ABC-2 type transport system permease protein
MQRASAGLNAALGTVLLLGVLLVGYLIAMRRFTRADLTADRVYTLTESTKEVVAGLDKFPLRITAYFSERVPKALKPQIDWIRDILAEYQAFGRGNVTVEFVDPGAADFPPAERDNVEKGYGVQPLQLQEYERDSLVAVRSYLSLVVLYGDKHERVDLLGEKESLLDPGGTLVGFEYALTRAILKVSQDELRGVGVLADAPPPPRPQEQDAGTGFRKLSEVLEKQYRVRAVDLKSGMPVPDDVETLIVARPKDLTEREVFEIDQFVMRGGKLILFVDRYGIDLGQGIRTRPLSSGIDGLLEHYGFRVGESLVGDVSCGALPVQTQQGPFRITQHVPYPFLVLVGTEGLDKQCPVVSRLRLLQLPWVSPVDLLSDRLTRKEVIRLVESSPNSWTATDAPLTLQEPAPPSGADTGSKLLGVAAIGKFPSFFAGKAIPKPDKPDAARRPHGEFDLHEPEDEIEKRDAERQVLAESPESRVMVVGSASIVSDLFLSETSGLGQASYLSQALLLNAVDWFTLGDALIRIRTRGIENTRIEEIADSKKALVRWSNVLGMPALLLVVWAVRAVWRRRGAVRFFAV